jgi:cytochrome d ubiquinol oxidase subunit I
MVANSWMQTPAGGTFENGRFIVTSYFEGIFNPDMPWAFSHMWIACLEATLFVVGGVSAWYILKKRHVEFFSKSFKVALMAAVLVTPLQIWLGDGSGRTVAEYQPTKLAAMEAHWETNPPGKGAPWKVLAWPNKDAQKNTWAIEVPDGLSLLITRSFTGQVNGLKDFPWEDQPPVVIPYYAFRMMIAIGFGLFFLMLWSLWAWYKGRLRTNRIAGQRRLLSGWVLTVPLGYAAVETGWITREVGRQPWVIYGLLRTSEGSSHLPGSAVGTSFLSYFFIYMALLCVFLVFAWRILKKGPDLSVGQGGTDRSKMSQPESHMDKQPEAF